MRLLSPFNFQCELASSEGLQARRILRAQPRIAVLLARCFRAKAPQHDSGESSAKPAPTASTQQLTTSCRLLTPDSQLLPLRLLQLGILLHQLFQAKSRELYSNLGLFTFSFALIDR